MDKSDMDGSEPLSPDGFAIAAKLRSDILFLEDRLQKLSAQKTPNTLVLQTYREMLENRREVLRQLEERQPLPLIEVEEVRVASR
jgi:hypothetical protein